MIIVVAILLAITGAIYAVPGIMPVAKDPVTRYGRIVSGLGLVIVGLSVGYHGADMATLGGLFLLWAGLAAFAAAILRQPCPSKA